MMVNGLISIGIFLVIQLVAAVWWASAMNTKMNYVIHEMKGVRGIEREILTILEKYSTKAEVATALIVQEKELVTARAIIEKEMIALWKKVDAIAEAIDCKFIKKTQ